MKSSEPASANQSKIFILALMILIVGGLVAVVASKKSGNKPEAEAEPDQVEQDDDSSQEASVPEPEQWTDLFANGLDDWTGWLGSPHYSVDLPGSPAVDPERRRPRIGYNDPKGVFKMVQLEGEPALRISGEISGGISSKQSYEDYHLSLQFKWGEKRWASAETEGKDAGIVIHTFGEPGVLYNYWRKGIEYQIRNWTAGDLWLLKTEATVPMKMEIRSGGHNEIRTFDRGYPPQKMKEFVYRDLEAKFKKTGWNTAEILTVEGDAVFLLNGTMVMLLVDMKKSPKDGDQPLTAGQIFLQSAGSEIFFKDVKMKKLDAFPAKFAQALKSARP